MTAFKNQVDGNHYKQLSYQPFQWFTESGINPGLALAIKYLTRIGTPKDSGGIGIQKAIHCIEMFNETIKLHVEQGKHMYGLSRQLIHMVQFTEQFPLEVRLAIQEIGLLQTEAFYLIHAAEQIANTPEENQFIPRLHETFEMNRASYEKQLKDVIDLLNGLLTLQLEDK